MPGRDGPFQEIEKVLSFIYLILLKPNEHTKKYHIRNPNEEVFVIEFEDKNYFYVGENSVCFETSDEILENFSKEGFNDIKFPYAYSKENIYFIRHRKYITIEEYKTAIQKNEYECLFIKDDELKGDVDNKGIIENGNAFSKCKNFHSKADEW